MKRFELSDHKTHQLTSRSTGVTYRIDVAWPDPYWMNQRGVDPDQPFPVLYVLDGQPLFGMVKEIARYLRPSNQLPDLLIVGIGYETDDPSEVERLRFRDLTPTRVESEETWLLEHNPEVAGEVISGGARDFLAFIRDELKPWVSRRFQADAEDATIVGHSLGGLFALIALFQQPDLFQRYLIGSPSLWWDHFITFQHEEAFSASHADPDANVFLGIGELEEDANDPQSIQDAMVANVEKLDERLRSRNYPGLKLTTRVFDGENHQSVVPALLSHGLRTNFGQ